MIVVSAVLVLSCGQTDAQTDSHTDADERFTPATVVGVSNKNLKLTTARRKRKEMIIETNEFISSRPNTRAEDVQKSETEVDLINHNSHVQN